MKTKSHFTKIAVALVCVLTLTLSFFGIGSLTASAADESKTYEKVELANIQETDTIIIVGTKSGKSYAMSNDKGTGSGPVPVSVTVSVTVSNNSITTDATNIGWNISNDNGNLTIYPAGTTETWLYCTNNNNGVRVGTNADNKIFTLDESGYLTNTATKRYLGIYNTQDWRCYTSSTATNIKGQAFSFYKLQESAGGGEETPECEHLNKVAIGEDKAATCTEPGITAGEECSDCGDTVTAQKTIPATGHNYVDGVCSVCGEEQPKTLTIIRDNFTGESGYAWHDWTATTTTGVTVSGSGYIYDNTKNSIQVNGSKDGDYIYNTTALPGKITSITLTKASGTDRNFDILTSDKPFDHNTVASLKESATAAKKLVKTEGVTWTFENGHRYFAIVITDSSAAYLSSIEITYEICIHETKVAIGENVAPGCETTGMTAGEKCADCGEIFKESEILEAKGHNYVDGTCTVCGESECKHENTTAIGEAKPATCTEDGITAGLKCSDCEEIITPQEPIPATGHNYDNRVCSVCGDIELRYDLVKDENTLNAGDKLLLVNSDRDFAMGAANSDNDIRKNVDIEADMLGEGVINGLPDGAVVIELVAAGDHWLLKVDGDKYLALTSNDNKLHTVDYEDEDTHKWDITVNKNGEAVITSVKYITRTIRYNSDYTRFACYKSGQQAVALYRYSCPHRGGTATCNTKAVCDLCGASYGELLSHTPEDDDDDCTTDILCSVCDAVTTKGNEAHTGGTATCTAKAQCSVCGTKYGELAAHTPAEDDGNCTTAINCTVCGTEMTPAKAHAWDNACDTACNNDGCTHTRTIEHTPEDDDGDCTTDILCSVCDAVTTKGNEAHTGGTATCTAKAECSVCGTAYGELAAHTPAEDDGDCTTAINCTACGTEMTPAKAHAWDNACDTACNNAGCNYTREITHTPAEDDGNCTTAINCTVCGTVTTEAKAHAWDNACDTACNNAGCSYTREITHTPAEDDGNCTTAINCTVCGTVTTEAKAHAWDNACDTACNNAGCNYTREITHTPAEDDGNCTTAINCTACGIEMTPAKAHAWDNACDTACNNDGCTHTRTIEHTPENDDGDCTTDILCSVCDAVTTKGNETHTGGTATCTAKAECSVCGKEYGMLGDHIDSAPADLLCDNCGTNLCENHVWVDGDVVTDGGCTADTVIAQVCEACGKLGDNRTVPAPGHTSAEDDSNCTTATLCTVCGEVVTAAPEAEHRFDNTCDTSCNNYGCNHTREITHTYDNACDADCNVCGEERTPADHTGGTATCTAKAECSVCGTAYGEILPHTPAEDDGDCTTAINCTVCGAETTAAKATHTGGTATCTAKAECSVCGTAYGDILPHTPAEDDGDCTTSVNCTVCGTETTAANATHTGGTATCTAKAECSVCGTKYGELAAHTPAEDDGNCTTAINCTVCGAETTAAKAEHTGGTATCTAKAECSVCGTAYGELLPHAPAEDDGNCTTAINCTVCGAETTAAKAEHTGGTATCTAKAECSVCGTAYGELLPHTPAEDDGDCTTAINCTVCGAETTAANATHTGGTATCTAKAECSVCGTAYGEFLAHTPAEDDGDCTTAINCTVCGAETTAAKAEHTGGTATCTAKAECSVCGTAYGEIDKKNHVLTTFIYTNNENSEAHTKKHECCDEIAIADEAHTYGDDDKCVCGAEKPTYTVTVENGKVEGNDEASVVVNKDGTVTIRANAAPDGKKFKGWAVDGKIVSTYPTYTFKAAEDMKLTAVYEDIAPAAPVAAPTFKQTVIALTVMSFLVLFALAAIVNRKRF